jgi:ABC-type Zn uptake system ZnuABC Zn-binding protein ZnuA
MYFNYNISVSIHITNKLFSSRSFVIICAITIITGFGFVSVLIFYFPRDNRINLNGLNSISIQSLATETKNQVVTTDLGVYNITKSIAKDAIPVIYSGPSSKLNEDYQIASNVFTKVFASKALITNGQDKWLERKKLELNSTEILNLSQSLELQAQIPAIDINFGTQQNEQNNYVQETYDYNYLLDDSVLIKVIENISNFLTRIDPTNKDLYYKNQIELTAKVVDTQNQYSNILLCSKTPILTNASNLNYIAQKYGLEISMFKNFDPTNPQPNQIKYLRDFAKSKNVSSFFVDKKIPLVDYTNLKNNLGLEIYYISDYIYPDTVDTLTKNLENLKKSQNCTTI